MYLCYPFDASHTQFIYMKAMWSATDGLFDNLYEQEVAAIANNSRQTDLNLWYESSIDYIFHEDVCLC